jgi:PAS domain S-box-containing protein
VNIVRDASERLQFQKKLQYSETRFRSLTENAYAAVISCDVSGCILTWNQGAQDTFGYTANEILGRSFSSIVPQDFWQSYISGAKVDIGMGKILPLHRSTEVYGTRKHGSNFPMDISLSSWRSEDRVFFIAVIRDISDRKHLEAVAEERQEIYESLLIAQSNLGEGMAIIDANTDRIIYANEAVCDMLGYTKDEILALGSPLDFITPEQRELVSKRIDVRRKRRLKRDHYEVICLRKDGSRFYGYISATYQETANGPSMIILLRDIDQRKKTEIALAEQQRINAQIFENSSDVIFTLDLEGNVKSVNPSVEKYGGWKAEELIDLPMNHTMCEEDSPAVKEALSLIHQGKRSPPVTSRFFSKSGKTIYVEIMFSPILQGGRVTSVLGVARDITEESR